MEPIVKGETEQSGAFRTTLTFEHGGHVLHADTRDDGGGGTAPDPHDLFDASVAACKALTAHWYARQRKFPLERVSTVLERDASREREGHYGLTVSMTFHGPLTDEQRNRLLEVAGKCPVHKLMTTVEVNITTRFA